MTIDEAAQLVIQSSSLSKTGNTFVLNMGKEIKIIDLAKQMIRLQGHNPIYKNEQKSNILKNLNWHFLQALLVSAMTPLAKAKKVAKHIESRKF